MPWCRPNRCTRRAGAAELTRQVGHRVTWKLRRVLGRILEDRKSTRLNSSHSQISYAVFCLKKKNYIARHTPPPGIQGIESSRCSSEPPGEYISTLPVCGDVASWTMAARYALAAEQRCTSTV